MAAEHGEAAAQLHLGAMYEEGNGVPQDFTQAAAWYRKAAEQGSAKAQYELALLYADGRGVPQDFAQAAAWYAKAAEQGHATAQSNLGRLYCEGAGLSKDLSQCIKWLILAKAASGGDAKAEKNLADAKSLATPDQISAAQALAREWWAAHHSGM